VAELDQLLSTTLKRIAPPADPSGVAEAIRARVDAGDAGTSATSSTAPGWGGFGGGGGGAAGWLPWIGVVLVVGLVGGGVGVSGMAGAATDETVVVGHTSVLDAVVDAGSCPGGPVVRTLSADTRVLAVARSEDSTFLGVRNPDDVAATIWVPASAVVPDAGQNVAGLPVGEACPTGSLAPPVVIVPVVPVEPIPEPAKPGAPPPPPPAPDTTAPTFGKAYTGTCTEATISVTDNVGVVGVTLQLTGTNTKPPTQMLLVGGGTWKLTYPFLKAGKTTFKFVAVDQAGNSTTISKVANLGCVF
jgi:hypothetical protein